MARQNKYEVVLEYIKAYFKQRDLDNQGEKAALEIVQAEERERVGKMVGEVVQDKKAEPVREGSPVWDLGDYSQ